MTRSAALVLSAALAATLPVHAAEAPRAADAPRADVSAAFGNTLLTVDPDGRTRKIWLKADGTWTGLSRRGLDLAGKWTTEGEKVCLSQAKPRLPGKLCEVFPSSVGRDVQSEDPTGKSVRLKLVKGRVAG